MFTEDTAFFERFNRNSGARGARRAGFRQAIRNHIPHKTLDIYPTRFYIEALFEAA
jgi:hypothetical protein